MGTSRCRCAPRVTRHAQPCAAPASPSAAVIAFPTYGATPACASTELGLHLGSPETGADSPCLRWLVGPDWFGHHLCPPPLLTSRTCPLPRRPLHTFVHVDDAADAVPAIVITRHPPPTIEVIAPVACPSTSTTSSSQRPTYTLLPPSTTTTHTRHLGRRLRLKPTFTADAALTTCTSPEDVKFPTQKANKSSPRSSQPDLRLKPSASRLHARASACPRHPIACAATADSAAMASLHRVANTPGVPMVRSRCYTTLLT
ncbi:uncharacterized protein B0H18DRAFT_101559 [Fomitopsis serialis]|uniref:uncharacterized protein n=1 Tax=Fomitopsis serialis TaxID=139415 RepID=UPI0020084313|nr:uncharacterized protein B0H18DRAFT_101559 [Neoantrodia serialis]KAH9931244.1 hypothetical protein B0H18DRAFT_101559 [Neoantrodia serialis]